jgi:hydroxypyruvate isomerase
VYELSANIELLFHESGAMPDRVRAAARLGIPAVEIWFWRDKDVDTIATALDETGVALQTMCVDPRLTLVDATTHDRFVRAVTESAQVADRLGCPFLVVTAGEQRPRVSRDEQRAAVVEALRRAADVLAPTAVSVLLENLNSRVDHPGTFLDSTAECLGIVEEVRSPRVRLLYDHYHSLVMDERPEKVLADRVDLVGHVQTADVPGRHEPGSGSIDWQAELTTLRKLGYAGRIGLEYFPTTGTERSLECIRRVAEDLP